MIAILTSLALAGLGLSAISNLAIRAQALADISDQMSVLLAAVDIDANNRLVLDQEPDDPRFALPNGGFYWQIGRKGSVELKSQSLWDQSLSWLRSGPRDPGQSTSALGPTGESAVAVENSIILGSSSGDQTIDVLVALDNREFAPARTQFFYAMAPSLAVLTLALIAAVFVFTRFGFKPLDNLRVALAAVHNRSEKLIRGDFPEEVQPLVDGVNDLITSREAQLERARVRAGDLAHGLKTPLAVLEATARGLESSNSVAATAIRDEVQRMEAHVRRALAQARAGLSAATMSTSFDAVPIFAKIVGAMERLSFDRGISFEAAMPEALWLRVDESDFTDIAGNLLDNARKWACSVVHVELSGAGVCGAVLVVDDDGPGLPAHIADAWIARGRRLDETIPGSGFGLAIAQDLVDAYGGDLTLDKSPRGGVRATVRLPG